MESAQSRYVHLRHMLSSTHHRKCVCPFYSFSQRPHFSLTFLPSRVAIAREKWTQPGKLPLSRVYLSLLTLVVVTLVTLLHFSSLLKQSPSLQHTGTEHVVDSISDISVRIAGQCRHPIVYVGVDTRRHLLHHYDLYAVPTRKYSPQKMNWARVAIIRFALKRCSQSSWVVYSDTDAYMQSRPVLETRLRQNIPSTMHVVYQHGMWSLNSGFHAWRMSNTSRKLAKQWNERYKPSKYFFAEQKALLAVCEHKNPGKTTGRPNGFLGWHLKGNARHKTHIANLGRFACRYEFIIRNAIWVLVGVAVVACLCGTPATKKKARRMFNLVTDFRVVLVLVLLVLTLYVLTAPFSRKRYKAVSLSSQSFTHLLPGGRVMVVRGLLCNKGYYCVKRNWQYRFWVAVSRMPKQAILLLFATVAVVEKSTLLYIYPGLVCLRAACWFWLFMHREKRAAVATDVS